MLTVEKSACTSNAVYAKLRKLHHPTQVCVRKLPNHTEKKEQNTTLHDSE